MKTTHRMSIVDGWSSSSVRVTYSYRGHTITRTYRTHDVRNKTHNGYWWAVKFKDGKSLHGLSRRADAKAAIDRFEAALSSSPASEVLSSAVSPHAEPHPAPSPVESLASRASGSVLEGR